MYVPIPIFLGILYRLTVDLVGYYIFLGSSLVLCSSKKQPTLSRSSCELEYCSLANVVADIVGLNTSLPAYMSLSKHVLSFYVTTKVMCSLVTLPSLKNAQSILNLIIISLVNLFKPESYALNLFYLT